MPAFDPVFVPFDSYTTTLAYPLGYVSTDPSNGKRYKFVRVSTTISGAATIPIASPVLMSGEGTAGSSLGFVITDKVADGLDTTKPIAMGVLATSAAVPKSTSTTTYYCWVQIAGPHTAVVKDANSIAVGDVVEQSTATDGVATALADGTTVTGALAKGVIGYAAAAALAGDTTVSMILCLNTSY